MYRIYPVYALSGFLSLGFQVAWFRVFTDRFGSTNLTFAFVLACFIGGLGAGSLASRRLTGWLERRLRIRDPLRSYGLVELLVAGTAALTALLPAVSAGLQFAYVDDGTLHAPGAAAQATQLGLSVVCVFGPCFFMGVTFPLLCDAARVRPTFPSSLYAWNTLGACSGLLVSEFVFLPWLGHEVMLYALVAANLGLGAWFLLRGSGPRTLPAEPDGSAAPAKAPPTGSPAAAVWSPLALLAVALVSGFLTGAFEADVLRRLQFFDCRSGAALSCVSFWAILAIFLGSTTVRWWPALTFRHLQIGIAAAVVVYWVVWLAGYPLRDWVNSADSLRVLQELPAGTTSYRFFSFGYGYTALLVFTGVFVFPPLYLVSLLLPYVCNAAQRQGRHLGVLYGSNTIAFCLGIVAFSTVVPGVNMFYAMRAFLFVFALCAVVLWLVGPQQKLRAAGVTAIAGLALIAIATPASFAPGWFLPDTAPARYPVRAMKSNGANTTYVVADPTGDYLFFDSHSMSGCNPPAQQYMRLMAHFPLLLQRQPKTALLVCFGVGNTASAIVAHDSIERLDVVDINHQVFATAPEFERYNRGVIDDPRVRLFHDDGRHFLDTGDDAYDLITSEPPPPMFPGVSRLYSVEYYEAAKARLTAEGMMTQWLPIDQMPLPAMRAALASFVQVFPHTLLTIGHRTNYVLVGSTSPFRLPAVEERFSASSAVVADLAPFNIARPSHLYLRVAACSRQLREQFGSFEGVSDLRNDWSHVFHDPKAPPVIEFDPVRVLAEFEDYGGASLACREELDYLMLHLGRLKTVVRDFPDRALATVARTDAVGMSGVDWWLVKHHVARSTGLLEADDLAGAISALQAAIALAPEYPAALHDAGVLLGQANRPEEALRVAQLLQAANPKSSVGACRAAALLVQLGREDDAIAAAERYLADLPRDVALLATYGEVLARAGRWPEAIAAYDRALAVDPNSRPIRDARERAIQRER